jgi:hypothetical protein
MGTLMELIARRAARKAAIAVLIGNRSMTYDAIALQFNVSGSRISKIARELNLPRRKARAGEGPLSKAKPQGEAPKPEAPAMAGAQGGGNR